MGWGSAGGYFDAVADALIEGRATDAVKTKVCSVLIGVFRGEDWDTHRDSLDRYAGDPAIVQAFREHEIILTCWNEDLSDGHWHECTLERLHPGDHSDGMRDWPRTEGSPMTDSTTTCPECGAPGWDDEERECETCAAISDLENARGQLAEAIEYEEWGAARNELEYLAEVIDTLGDALEAIGDPNMYGQLVDLLDPAVAQYNAAVEQSNAAGGWR